MRHRTEFSSPGDLALGICTPLREVRKAIMPDNNQAERKRRPLSIVLADTEFETWPDYP